MTLRQRAVAERKGGGAVLAALCLILALALTLRVAAAIDPSRVPLPDSVRYEQIAADLYRRGSFGDPGFSNASDYSPGTPLLVAGVYYLTGGIHPTLARLLMAALSAAAALLAFLLVRRLAPRAGPWPALLAALLVAVYPVFRSFAGMVLSEPLAACALTAAVLAVLWADQRASPRAWALPGLLLGVATLVRPDYLPLGAGLALLAGLRVAPVRGRRDAALAAGLTAIAFAVPILPWTVRNLSHHHRFVPISTGGGKALFIGTYLPAYDGSIEAPRLNERIRERLFESHPGLRRDFRREHPGLPVRGATGEVMETLAQRLHPGTRPDQALTRMGLDNLGDYVAPDPLHAMSVSARKAWFAWSNGDHSYYHPTMKRSGFAGLHLAIVALGLLGLLGLAARRRWEALPLGALVAWVAVLTVLLIPSPRRVLVLVPVLSVLASLGVVALVALARSGIGRLEASRRSRPRASPRSG